MLRVLHVNKYLYRRGGAEAYMLELADLQTRAGHQVAFFGMDHQDNLPQRYAAHFPPYLSLDPPPSSVGGRLATAAHIVYSPASRRGIEQVVRSFRPDVAHVHNIYHQLSPSVLRPLAEHGVPTVLTLHDYKLICPSYQLLDHGRICEACLGGRFHHAVLRRCKDGSLGASTLVAVESTVHRLTRAYGVAGLMISPSRFLAGKMLQAGVYPERLTVLDHFVDTAGTAPKATPGGKVVFAGRLAPEKGLDALIEAIARVGAGAELDVAGDGPERARLEALAAARAPGRVRFHGRLPKDRLLDLIRAAAVVAVPSRWHENQPMAVLEAFACGVPVVTTNLGGLPELVDQGRDGVVVDADDLQALAGALEGLLADPERAFAMGRAARAKAERRFAPERHLDQLQRLYQRVA
jgi:glycosyltransferase involved in cell wall biosynthesis